MNNIDKAINEIMDYTKELKEENQKQKRILSILKPLIEIMPNSTTDAGSIYDIRIKPLKMIDDKILLELKGWLDEKDEIGIKDNILGGIKKDLEELEHYRKVKAYIDRLYEKPFYQKTESGYILKYEQGEDYHCIEYDFEDDAIDIIDYESVLFIKVEDIEKEIIFYNEDIEKQHQKQEEEEERKWEEQKKNNPIWCCTVMNCTSGGNKDEK